MTEFRENLRVLILIDVRLDHILLLFQFGLFDPLLKLETDRFGVMAAIVVCLSNGDVHQLFWLLLLTWLRRLFAHFNASWLVLDDGSI